MANLTALRGSCVAPFFQESHFPTTGGFVLGRYCAPMPGSTDEVSCCLPCPATDWVYPDNFLSLTRMAGWINVFGLVLTIFILLSFIFLPKERTKRQYLNVCLILGIILMELGFIIPLGAQPTQCYNEITPNDMTSSMTCAWSGALIVAGGVSITMWILIRTLSMHLQICWDITPGVRFFYTAQFFGWAISAGIVAAAMAVSGVSFRFGDACHINHRNSLQSLWGPLMGVAGISFILQIATFIYCMNVYLRNLRYDSKPPSSSHYHPPSPYTKSEETMSPNPAQRNPKARAVYKRVTKVLSLQWRGLLICFIMLVDIAFFSVVFVYFDTRTQAALSNFTVLLPWLVCLINSVQPGNGGKDACLSVASHIVVSEPIVIATLLLLSIIGVQALLLVGRAGMLAGWFDLARTGISTLHRRRRQRSIPASKGRSYASDTDTESLAATSTRPTTQPTSTPLRPYELRTVAVPSPSLSTSGFTPLITTTTTITTTAPTSPLSPALSTASPLSPPATAHPGPLARSDWFSADLSARLAGAPPPRSPAAAALDRDRGRRYCSPRMSFSSPHPPGSAGRGAAAPTPLAAAASSPSSASAAAAVPATASGLPPVVVLGEWDWERERAGAGRFRMAGLGLGGGEAVVEEEKEKEKSGGNGNSAGVGKEGWV